MIVAMQSVDTLMSAIAMTTPRVLGAFLMLPLLTQENTPAMVRNSILISLAVIRVSVRVLHAAFPNSTPVRTLVRSHSEMCDRGIFCGCSAVSFAPERCSACCSARSGSLLPA